MKKGLGLLAFATVLFLVGCATSYQPLGMTGGFSETRISDDTYQVKFSGNGNTSGDKVWYYWIYRCAELTKSKGYNAFVLISDKAASNSNDKLSGASASLQPATMGSGEEPVFVNAKGGGGYYYIPSYGGRITTYSASAFVRFLKEPIPDSVSYYKAPVILEALKPYIDSEGNTVTKVPSRVDLLKQALVLSKDAMTIGELPNSTAPTTLDDYKSLLPAKQ
ncbi:hypothetical protein EDC30_106155 [Paucimonas lemoignei]|uniref:Lipoprotein n=1 Tax=Paucimonas lemoignei TaxID=29443 RepID=A0A4R3HVN0_PAULE|nr:hypothetical protein [Paucimonas lemoignei]TCS36613.1 hypothetical protein EDC30_106155 [Paucimonas lemoignei]